MRQHIGGRFGWEAVGRRCILWVAADDEAVELVCDVTFDVVVVPG